MIFYSCTTLLFAAVYTFLILWIKRYWDSVLFPSTSDTKTIGRVSVVVVGRNESANIANCLKSIANNGSSEGSYEIIYVDDNSTDDTVTVVENLNIVNLRVLHLKDYHHRRDSKSFKKRAINYAISVSNGDYILTTDADCIVGKNWIKVMLNQLSEKNWLATGPVCFVDGSSLLHRFQRVEMMGLMAVTNAGVASRQFFMANGANMIFDKKKFIEIGGYEGNWQYASGDDMFLIDKLAQIDASKLTFVKEKAAIVSTASEKDWYSFLNQRIRWTTKTGAYNQPKIKLVLGFVFIYCTSILLSAVAGFWYSLFWKIAIVLILVKALIDYFYLQSVARFFTYRIRNLHYLPLIGLHILYVSMFGILGLLPLSYIWKGRKVN